MPRPVLVLALLALMACQQGSPGYTTKVERDFVGGCTASGASTSVCQCVYDKVVHNIAYDDFAALDDRRRTDPGYLSPELRRFAVDCATEDVLRGG